MISSFDSGEQAIDKLIVDMAKKLEKTHPSNSEYMTLVNAIASLRSSRNAPIIAPQE